MQRIKEITRIRVRGLGNGVLITERWGINSLYEGMQVKRNPVHIAKVQYNETGEIVKNGNIVRHIGTTDDVINDDLTAKVRTISMVSGRDKPTANKKANGEDRRKRCENQALSFGVSRSKAYHKAKHSK
jgi:hypothetical protein